MTLDWRWVLIFFMQCYQLRNTSRIWKRPWTRLKPGLWCCISFWKKREKVGVYALSLGTEAYSYVKNWCRCAGKIPFNHQIVRKVASVCNQLPTIETQAFKDDFTSEYSDALLVAYLASITKYVVVGGDSTLSYPLSCLDVLVIICFIVMVQGSSSS